MDRNSVELPLEDFIEEPTLNCDEVYSDVTYECARELSKGAMEGLSDDAYFFVEDFELSWELE